MSDPNFPLHSLCSDSQTQPEDLEFFMRIHSGMITKLVNEYDQNGRTALHYCCSHSCTLSNLLLDRGANPNLPTLTGGHVPLFVSCHKKNPETFRLLLERGADLQITDLQNWNVMHWISHSDASDCLKELLKHKKFDTTKLLKLFQQKDTSGNLPLHIMALSNATKCLLVLGPHFKKWETNPDDLNNWGYAPLHLAVKKNFEIFVRAFLALKTLKKDINIYSTKGKSSLHYSINQKNAKIMELLFKNGADIYQTSKKSNLNSLQIIRQSQDEELCSRILQFIDEPSIWGVLKNGNEKQLRNLVKNDPEQVNVFDRKGNTPLHYIANNGNVNFLEIILNYVKNINIINFNNQTPLHCAIRKNYFKIVSLLCEHGGDLNLTKEPKVKYSSLHQAIKQNNFQIISFLIKSGVNINLKTRDKKETTGLHLCLKEIIKNQDHSKQKKTGKEILELLLNSRITNQQLEINLADHKGRTSLNYWVSKIRSEELDITEMLLKKEANSSIFNNEGLNTLHIAIERQFDSIVKLLLKYNVEITPTRNGIPALHLSISITDNTSIALTLLEYPNCLVMKKDSEGNTAYHLAAIYSRREHLAIFHQSKSDFSWKNNEGNTVLHVACQAKNNKIGLQTILGQGENVKEKLSLINYKGQTALHIAASHGFIEYVDILIERGIQIEAKDDDGYNSTTLSGICQQKICFNHLLQRGGISLPHLALQNGNFEQFKRFIKNGFPVEYLDLEGYSCLHRILINGDNELLSKIINYIKDINSKTINGETPIQIVAKTGNLKACRILVPMGAELRKYEEGGNWPHVLAKNNNYPEVAEYLSREFKYACSVFEIYETEEHYLNNLELLIYKIIIPLQKNNILKTEEIEIIFGNIEDLYQAHFQFHIRLKRRLIEKKSPKTDISDIIIESIPSFACYQNYAKNYENATSMLKKCNQKQPYENFIKEIFSKEKIKGTSVKNLIHNPIRRLPDLQLLIKSMIKKSHPDNSDVQAIQTAHKNISVLCDFLNSVIHQNKNRSMLKKLQNSFKNGIKIQLFKNNPLPDFLKKGMLYFNEINIPKEYLENENFNSDNLNIYKKSINYLWASTKKNKESIINTISNINLTSFTLGNKGKNNVQPNSQRDTIFNMNSILLKEDPKMSKKDLCKNHKKRKIFLFSNSMIICSGKSAPFEVIAIFKLINTFFLYDPNFFLLKSGHIGFILFTETGSFLFSSNDSQCMNDWCEIIQKTIETNKKNYKVKCDNILLNQIEAMKLLSNNIGNEDDDDDDYNDNDENGNSNMLFKNSFNHRFTTICYYIQIDLNSYSMVVKNRKFTGFLENKKKIKKMLTKYILSSKQGKYIFKDTFKFIIIPLDSLPNQYFLEI
ncbi:no mechanoreceptor potential c isoform d-related [Anaeramoeba flamelloides]|uniref:No mechanoreceptor potential c isoform d-related n=1 Tax=Anaeramoeba flamelloides TaxID=1746091 RepID=A0AAV7YLN9_9EUKA|nr:no mechanoreceptor potential c isoform d-related [Anaeramoeba flamelloides]